ncbi:MAG: hypothetical protein K9N06_03905 [Candidatus Cloacimonetes bacterium]|nr:hypothetical protein [Candidatus Cloacimonadota bacterium]
MFYNNKVTLLVVIITGIFFISGCTEKTTEPESKERWHFVSSLGTGMITGMYTNESGTQLSVTNDTHFAIFTPDNTEPEKTVELETKINTGYFQYNPSIDEDYYFYCDEIGQFMYIGDTSDGEYIGSIPVTDFVNGEDRLAKFIKSDDWRTLNHPHITSDGNGFYMIPVMHFFPGGFYQGDSLYFGKISFNDTQPVFEINHIVNAYEEESTAITIIASNYYYGGYFWNCNRGDGLHPPLTSVNKLTYSTQYLYLNDIIKYVFEDNGFLMGMFYGKVKKSYDGGFTWEEWLNFNAVWDRVKIADKDMLFFSCNLASIDFETLEIENYDVGELYGLAITGLAEFDGKIFAGTQDGLYYCDLEDAFKLKENNSSRKEESLDLEIVEE